MRQSVATHRRSLFVGSLVGLALGAAVGCGGLSAPPAQPPGEMVPPYEVTLSMPPTPRTQPPAVSGGTLLVLADGKTAVAADPDRDVLWIADLEKLSESGRVDLQSGDEPGRLVQDSAGKVHVALRRGGALLTIDPVAGKITDRRPACAAPRGLAYDPRTDRLHLACAGGEIVTFAASGGPALRTLQLDRDLRDVVVKDTSLLVSRFRSAELLTIDASGSVTARIKPKAVRSQQGGPAPGDPMGMALAEPAVAWQIHLLPDGKVAMLFERGTTGAVDTTRPGGYGNGQCKSGGIVGGALTLLGPSGDEQPGPSLPMVAYSVDFAVAADGSEIAVVNTSGFNLSHGFYTFNRAQLATPSDPCGFSKTYKEVPFDGEIVAIAYDGKKRLFTQVRNPMRLVVDGLAINFKSASDVSNAGHKLFHTPTQSAIACVSCHPEGGDDGRVWNFTPIGARRTQELRGGILATAPFHWDGDMTDMHKLMTTVLVGRMGGPTPSSADETAIAGWLDAQPTLPKAAPANPQAVARGKQLFENAAGCATCHSGAHFTNNATVSVGTGAAFQVPSLVDVATRAPYMHSGCASTLEARFEPSCGGGDNHGKTSQLSSAELADLVSYLQTL